MLSFLKTHKSYFVIAALCLLAGAAAVNALQNSQNTKKYEIFEVKPFQLSQAVDATGYLQPATSVNLAFHASGQVAKVMVDVGQRAKKGDVLATLVNDNQKASLAQNKAVLSEAQAALNLALAKATDQDIEIARSDVQQAIAQKNKAQVDYNNAVTDLENTKKTVGQDVKTAQLQLQNAQLNLQKVQTNGSSSTQESGSTLSSSVDAVKSAINQLMATTGNLLKDTDLFFGVNHSSILTVQESTTIPVTVHEYSGALDYYAKNQAEYQEIKTKTDALSPASTPDDLIALYPSISDLGNNLNSGTDAAKNVLDKAGILYPDPNISSLRNTLSGDENSLSSAVTSYQIAEKSLESAVISNGNTLSTTPLDSQSAQLLVDQQTQNLEKVKVDGETAISSKENAVKSYQALKDVADAAVAKANASLDKVLADPRAVDIAPYRARVQQAQAGVAKAQSDYNDTLLTAPFDGVITVKNIDPGEQFFVASGVTNSPALGMIDDSKFHIDVDVPETQIARISPDSTVKVTFDSLGPEVVFDGKILSIEPASTTIETIIYYKTKIALTNNDPRLKPGMTANVIISTDAAPAVLAIPGSAVSIDSDNNKTVTTSLNQIVKIQTGMQGDNGMVQVLSGLQQGDSILVPLN